MGKLGKMHHNAFLTFVLQIFGVRKSDVYFLHNGIHNQSKFYFQNASGYFSVSKFSL